MTLSEITCVCGKTVPSNKKGCSCGRSRRIIAEQKDEAEVSPDWSGNCFVCGMSPVVPATGMCGPCTFGEAATMHGDW